MICNSTTTKTSKHHSCSLNHKHTGNLISFLTWLSATRKLQSISTSAKIFQIHLPTLTQIVTQVCAKACGRSGQIAVKFRIFCWRNGRIVLKIARNHEPIAAGSHEVSGSIPLISTKKKDTTYVVSFFLVPFDHLTAGRNPAYDNSPLTLRIDAPHGAPLLPHREPT